MTIKLSETGLDGCFVIEFDRREDNRGWFQRSFGVAELDELGLESHIVQANLAETTVAGTVRGMHFQSAPHGENKLFHCVQGSVFDVAVDLREESSTFGKWFGITLSSKEPKALFIPKGFAHGYMSLTENVLVNYYVSENYNPQSEIAVSPLNIQLGIAWPLTVSRISEKDSAVDVNSPLPTSGY